MIQIEFSRDTLGNIQQLIVKGHAQSGEYGKDLVCAGVSAIVTGSFNAITLKVKELPFLKLEEGFAEVSNLHDKKAQDIVEILLIQLQTIEESYPKYIKIKERL